MATLEIFITLAIAGVMMALLLPAVQAAREGRRRAEGGGGTGPAKRLVIAGSGAALVGLGMLPFGGGGGAVEGTGALDTSFVPQSTATTQVEVEGSSIRIRFHADETVSWTSRVDIRVEEGGCVFGSYSAREGRGRWTSAGSEASGTFRHRSGVDVREGPCDPIPEQDLANRDLEWELAVDRSTDQGAGTLHDVRPDGTGALDIPFTVAFAEGSVRMLGGSSVPSRPFAGTVAGLGILGAAGGWYLRRMAAGADRFDTGLPTEP